MLEFSYHFTLPRIGCWSNEPALWQCSIAPHFALSGCRDDELDPASQANHIKGKGGHYLHILQALRAVNELLSRDGIMLSELSVFPSSPGERRSNGTLNGSRRC